MIHERFDIERWKAEFPLARLREESRAYLERWVKGSTGRWWAKQSGLPTKDYIMTNTDWWILLRGPTPDCAATITGPLTIAVIEQLREEKLAGRSGVERVPTDLFVFGRGEPERRDVTKVGGLPYWPASGEWPCDPFGAPLTFIAQFNFADSHDIAGNLPDDILLIFASRQHLLGDLPSFSGMHFVWLPQGISDLVHPDQVPITDWPIMPCYGQIYRTTDLIAHGADGGEWSEDDWYDVLDGMKIGGVPCKADPETQEWIGGRFLSALSEIRPNRLYPFPYVNIPSPLGYPPGPEDHALTWADCDLVNFFIDGDEVKWHLEM